MVISSRSCGRADVQETGTLWVHSVSQEILDSVDDREKSRQEAINEVIYTERDFVRDLEYLKENWVKPLLSNDIIPAARREDFVRQVFWNVHDVWNVNHILAERLTKRQKQQPVVQSLGDLFLERVPLFEPFVAYGAHQLFGKYEFEKEKGANPAFQKFVDVSASSGFGCCSPSVHPIGRQRRSRTKETELTPRKPNAVPNPANSS
jgi:hypothetical protein